MKEYINKKDWNDCLLESIIVEYDKAQVNISHDDNEIKIICNNFIGIQYLGQWDENVIKNVNVYEGDTFCEKNKDIVKQHYSSAFLGGGVKKQDSLWYHVEIELIDGVTVNLACMDVSVIESLK